MSLPQVPWRVGVVIPALDEVERITASVTSVRRACAHLPAGVSADIVVVADSCTDATASVACAALAGAGQVVATSARSVGVSRAVGVERILRRSTHPLSRTWLANTDADSVVPPTWLSAQLAMADAGAAAVAGIIEVDTFAELTASAGTVFHQRYTAQLEGTHTHVHGANLGVRADAYIDVGGWAPLVTAEDHDLWHRLKRRWPLQSVSSIVVTTSGRRIGRAPGGFAVGLDELSDELAVLSEPAA